MNTRMPSPRRSDVPPGELAALCMGHRAGLQVLGSNGQAAENGTADPLAAIRSVNALAATDTRPAALVNFHRFLQSAETQAVAAGCQRQAEPLFSSILSPIVSLPTEIE